MALVTSMPWLRQGHQAREALLSGCFPQTPGVLRPPARPGPDSYFSLSTKGLGFIMQFTHIFFSFFTNMLMNEGSVLPDLLPDLLPACIPQLPGRG